MTTLLIAIGQTVPRLQDTEANMAEACRLAAEAGREGARLILLPEGCLTGNSLSVPEKQATLPVEPAAFADLQAVAREGDITICAGFATPCEDKFNIVHAIVGPDRVRFQRKAFLASTEPPFLAACPDPAREVFHVDGVRTVITICSEFGAPPVMTAVAAAGPHLILHPSAGRMDDDEVIDDGEALTEAARRFPDKSRDTIRNAALDVAEHGIPRLAANPIGFDGETWWPGNSYAIASNGTIVATIPGENSPNRMQACIAVEELPL